MEQTKYCSECKTWKIMSMFYKDSNSKDGKQHKCKSCQNEWEKNRYKNNPQYKSERTNKAALWRKNNKEKHKKWAYEYYRKNKDRQYGNSIKRKYGVTLETYRALMESQNHKCKICGISRSEININFAVDHDHKTGELRGLLCDPCNKAIGFLKDDPKICSLAAEYLKSHEGKNGI